MRLLGDGKIGKEQEVDKGINQLLGKRFGVLKVLRPREGTHKAISSFIEEDLVGDGR